MAQTILDANVIDSEDCLSVPSRNAPTALAVASISRVDGAIPKTVTDVLAVEEPLEIQLRFGPAHARQTRSITVTMRTPGHDEELAAGFLLTEGVLEESAQILRIDAVAGIPPATDEASVLPITSPGNSIRVELAPDVAVRTATLERNFYTTSSCGVCGKASLLALRSVCPPRRSNDLFVSVKTIYALPGLLRASQPLFATTGGLHGAALFTAEGHLVLSREDVGRHNAVDKLLGHQFLEDAIPLRDKILMLSGRVSFELLQKAVMGGIPMVVAVGAPSSLAVRVAQDFDITLIAFLRDGRFNVYHGLNHITEFHTFEELV